MQTTVAHQVFAAGEGTQVLRGLGTEIAFKVTGEETDGRCAILEYTAPPRFAGPPLHIHEHTDEVYYILEGSAQLVIGAETVTAGPGALVFIPRGTPHTFANPHDAPARMLVVLTPAGFEQYFVELFALLSEGSNRAEYLEKMRAIAAKYDQVLVGEAAGH
jgi:mannose-6-phosphate isomerase-like protein (cupin superfamily)